MKLSAAQRALLSSLRIGRRYVAEHYRPLQILLRLGFAKPSKGFFGQTLYDITPAGRAALEESDGAQES
jgi:hypothetical protein